MSDPKTVIDIVRLPFKLAKRITSPVADAVERYLGPEIEQIVGNTPGFNVIEGVSKDFNDWVSGREVLPNDDDEAGAGNLDEQRLGGRTEQGR
ncbi:MAG TPA: hypothetical protein PLU72_16995 [Candidatus Ozemobacteraceae bacterium]|nr:hypothetical protein [Candidatus Ozemobacteraceae bacterium]